MHSEVLKFVKFLGEVGSNHKAQLDMIQLRVNTTSTYYEYAQTTGKKMELKEQLQQYMDLFAHVYYKKSLREFGNLIVFASIH